MPRYRVEDGLIHFCTITVLDWLPVLIESRFADPIIESLRFCRREKGLRLFGFVIMPHHLHLVCAADALPEVMRDFKRFTSRQIHDRLKNDGRETILHWLEYATQRARRAHGELGLWQDGFHPQAIWSPAVLQQKLRYLHENPVRKGLVRSPEEWWYSSARFYEGCKEFCMDVDDVEG